MKYHQNKDINKFIKTLVYNGWYIKMGKHLKLIAPNNLGIVVCSLTPGCNRALKNIQSDVKKILGKK
jgi:hypothetical protein